VISVRAYRRGGEIVELKSEEISDVVDRKDQLLWVDVSDPDDHDLACLQEEFSLHPLAVEDVRHRHQRPKLESYPDHCFLVAYTAELVEVDFFFTPTWLVSVREAPPAEGGTFIDAARKRFDRTRPKKTTVGFLLYVLLDELVDDYFDATEKAEDTLEDLEDVIFAEEGVDERGMQQKLFGIRRRLVEFRRVVVPLRDVMSALLRKEVEWLDDATVIHMQDVYDHVLRAIDQVDSQRELMGNAVDAHLALISNRMNLVMKRMTSWGAILIGSTLIAGIYGMNFDHMPELHWRFGYLFALGLMAVLTVGGYRYFKKRDYL
jgi:magnesium transporter